MNRRTILQTMVGILIAPLLQSKERIKIKHSESDNSLLRPVNTAVFLPSTKVTFDGLDGSVTYTAPSGYHFVSLEFICSADDPRKQVPVLRMEPLPVGE